MTPQNKNTLYYGDCLGVMRQMPRESVDLIYLDPPFNSNRVYNTIYRDELGRELPDQVEAFHDIWRLDADKVKQIKEFKRSSEVTSIVGQLLDLWIISLQNNNPSLMAYLFYMVERLLVMKKILKPTGSIYFHCDPTASHYIKPCMDVIFGHNNFRNEIIWRIGWVSGFKTQKRGWIRNHDTILYYTASKEAEKKFNKEYIPYDKDYVRRDGKPPTGKGIPIEDTWNCSENDILNSIAIMSYSKEKVGYPTQKPIKLLKRIIKASSNEGDVVLDPFCGCATTIVAAHVLRRRWIGIDISYHAINEVSKKRLWSEKELILRQGVDYEIDGVPRNLEEARDLWRRDKYHFQSFAINCVQGHATNKRTADGGIDGRIFFTLATNQKHSSMVIEVKGGSNVDISVVRSLRGVLEKDDNACEMAGLIVLEELGERKKFNFMREMAAAGTLKDGDREYDRMQMLSMSEILSGKRFDTPYIEGAGDPLATLKGDTTTGD